MERTIKEGDLVKVVFTSYNNLIGNRTALIGYIEWMPAASGDSIHIREYHTGKAFAINPACAMFMGMTHIAESELSEEYPPGDWGDLAGL